jgi:hypothetical protein
MTSQLCEHVDLQDHGVADPQREDDRRGGVVR